MILDSTVYHPSGGATAYHALIDHQANSLGLALILKTHFDYVTKEVQKRQKPMKPASFFKKQQEKSELVSYLQELNSTCFVCSRIDQFFYRYVDTVFYLYQKDEEFRQKTENC